MSETGERGPRGDHGQHGDTGSTGEAGATGKIGEVGETGEKGERGPTGDLGPRGSQGLPGAQGKQGVEGKIPPKVWRGFWGVVIVATVVLIVGGCQIRNNRHLIRQINENRIADCQRTSRLLVTLIQPGLKNLDKISYYDTHPDEKRVVRLQTEKALRLADPSHC